MSLIDKAMELPDDSYRNYHQSWFTRLSDDMQQDVLAFFEAFEKGKLSKKISTARGAATWLSQEIEKQTGNAVKPKTIEEWARQRRQRQ